MNSKKRNSLVELHKANHLKTKRKIQISEDFLDFKLFETEICLLSMLVIGLIHDSHHVGGDIMMQVSHVLCQGVING